MFLYCKTCNKLYREYSISCSLIRIRITNYKSKNDLNCEDSDIHYTKDDLCLVDNKIFEDHYHEETMCPNCPPSDAVKKVFLFEKECEKLTKEDLEFIFSLFSRVSANSDYNLCSHIDLNTLGGADALRLNNLLNINKRI